MMLWYVSGPFTAPTADEMEQNAQRAEDAAVTLRRDGHAVIVPHRNGGSTMEYDFCLAEDLEILKRRDAVFMMEGWEQSPGATKEHALAKHLGKDIAYEAALRRPSMTA